MVKTGFTHCGKYFGSKWSGKRKISRPRNRREEVLGLEWNLLAVKRDLLASKMSAKQLPRQVYTGLRSRRVVKMKTTEELVGDGEEHGRTRTNPTADLFYGVARTYRC